MTRYRHYRNFGEGNECTFITTTCLDFAPLFRTPERREEMARRLLSDHHHYGARLNAFVIMPEHLHWLCQLPPDKDVSWFVNRIKTNSGKWLLTDLTNSETFLLSKQDGLNRRSVWQRSFRSITVTSSQVRHQKQQYIFQNPVRRGLVEDPFSYRWSTARFHEFGEWDDDFGLPNSLEVILGCRWPFNVEQ